MIHVVLSKQGLLSLLNSVIDLTCDDSIYLFFDEKVEIDTVAKIVQLNHAKAQINAFCEDVFTKNENTTTWF